MERDNEQDFTFGEDDVGNSYRNDLTSGEIAKLNQKVTFLSILLPLVVIIMVVFIYFDISSKVVKVDSSGDARVQTISKELEKTVAELKTKSLELEKRLNGKIETIEKSIGTIEGKLKKAEKNISFMTWSKTNKKENDKKIGALKKTTVKLGTELAALTEKSMELDEVAESVRKSAADIKGLGTSVTKLKNELNSKKSAVVNRSDLDNSLKKQKRIFRLELDQFTEKFNKKLALIKYAVQTNNKPDPGTTEAKQ